MLADPKGKDAQGMPSERTKERFLLQKPTAALAAWIKGLRLRLLHRLLLAFLLVTLLGAGVSAAGLWFTNSAAQSVETVQKASEQIRGIEQLQRDWLQVIGSVDLMLLTRSLGGMQAEVEQNLVNFRTQLASVSDQVSASGQAANIQEVQQVALELEGVMEEFYGLIRAGRWGSAQTVRYAKLSALQLRLEESLSALNQNIQADVQESMETARRTQAIARGVWAATAFLALAFSVGISWYSSQAIARPIEQLTSTVEKATVGGVETAMQVITPPKRQDEIGELWRAFATLTVWLGEAYQTQEKRVEERTRDLERRRSQVQAAAEVARDITRGEESQEAFTGPIAPKSVPGTMKNLLDKSVELIRDRFGFYHAGIFLLDDRREFAVLRAATGEAGEKMVSDRHRLRIGQIGLVGYVAETGSPRIAMDVDKDSAHFRNPLLPDTRSEVALPIRTRDQVIGVLDVQSQDVAAFDEQDVIILQIIADQLATAIENRRLVNELEIRLEELESFTTGYGRRAWERLALSNALTGLEYDGESIHPLKPEQQTPITASSSNFRRFPLKLRGEVIANLDVWSGASGFSAQDTFLLDTFTSRISQLLESARLFNEAQERATREQLLNQLTSNIVRSIEPQIVLKVAAQQLESLPSIARASVFLTSQEVKKKPEKRTGPFSQSQGTRGEVQT